MPITPDTKDWTWVIEQPCPECGVDSARIIAEQVGSLIRDNVEQWQAILARPVQLTERPDDDRWSALEYACHVRDVFRLYDERLRLMRTEDDPTFPNWDQDATAAEDRYGAQDPEQVSVDLAQAGLQLAARFEEVAGDEWLRTGTRSDGARFTIETFARYLLHDLMHHIHDVEQGFATFASRR